MSKIIHRGMDCTQSSFSSNPSLLVHSDTNSHSGNISLYGPKMPPIRINHHNTSFKDVNSHHEEVKKVKNSNKADIVSQLEVHDSCNDSLCMNFLSVEDKKKFHSCQKNYEAYKKSKVKRTSSMSESCHFRDGKGNLIIRMKGNVVGRIKIDYL